MNLSDTIEYTGEVSVLATFPARNQRENESILNQRRFYSLPHIDFASGKSYSVRQQVVPEHAMGQGRRGWADAGGQEEEARPKSI